jgi:hypothetical protein
MWVRAVRLLPRRVCGQQVVQRLAGQQRQVHPGPHNSATGGGSPAPSAASSAARIAACRAASASAPPAPGGHAAAPTQAVAGLARVIAVLTSRSRSLR